MSATPQLSIVMPVYNEARQIEVSLERIREWLVEHDIDGEVVVVDNASTDDTAALAKAAGVEVLVNERNRGKGYSVRRGMLHVQGDLRMMCDADCWRSLPSLPDMLESAKEFDVVIGSRLAPGARVERPQTAPRRIVGPLFLRVTRALMSEPSTDVYCGFKIWHAEAAEAIFSRATIDGWAFDAEVLALGRRMGFTAIEQGILWINGEESKLSIPRTILPAVIELSRARIRQRKMSPATRQAAELSSARLP